MKLSLTIGLLFLGTTLCAANLLEFKVSPGSSELKSLSTDGTAVFSKCGEEITAPKGIIEKSYEQGIYEPEEKCAWKIKAPKDKEVNIVFLSFKLEQDKEDYIRSTVASFSDLSKPEGEQQLLQQFYISESEKVSRFSQPIRAKEMMIEIYRLSLNKYFPRQTIIIHYELSDVV